MPYLCTRLLTKRYLKSEEEASNGYNQEIATATSELRIEGGSDSEDDTDNAILAQVSAMDAQQAEEKLKHDDTETSMPNRENGNNL